MNLSALITINGLNQIIGILFLLRQLRDTENLTDNIIRISKLTAKIFFKVVTRTRPNEEGHPVYWAARYANST